MIYNGQSHNYGSRLVCFKTWLGMLCSSYSTHHDYWGKPNKQRLRPN